jgi:dTDP-4-amino-4,6-dideoxygalactose transaminase
VQPIEERDPGHVYHLFPIRAAARDLLQSHLAAAGIETLIHYPVPLSDQPALAAYQPARCPIAAAASRTLLSLPLHPRLSDANAAAVAREVGAFRKGSQPA